MSDLTFEDIIGSSGNKKNAKNIKSRESMESLCVGLGEIIPIKVLVFIFITYLLLNSDYFVTKILVKIPNAVEGQVINGTGVIVQALLYVFLCGLFIALDKKELI